MFPNNQAVVFLVHGTRNVQAGEVIHTSLKDLCTRFAQTIQSEPDAVDYGFLEIMKPSLNETLETLCRAGKTDIRIIPLLLFPGTHLYVDIPEIAQTVMDQFPGVNIHTAPHIGVEDPAFMEILLKRVAHIG